MKTGYGYADITPQRSMPLCGFAARCDAPFSGIDDPLYVRALAVEDRDQTVVLLTYDLLALGPEIHAEIQTALESLAQSRSIRPEWVLCATHTHSAPAAIILLGCGTIQRDYWETLVPASRAAAEMALNALRPARVRWTIRSLTEHSYNRRHVLTDGRVVMTRRPDTPVRKTGPIWERMLMVRFDDDHDRGIAGIASWAAHPVTVGSANVTADFPGELCRRLAVQHGFPFLYLQGACGNLNPVFEEMTRSQMLKNVDSILDEITDVSWPHAAGQAGEHRFSRQSLELAYGPLPTPQALHSMCAGMEQVAQTGDGPDPIMKTLADILNVPPGQRPEPGMARHIAGILQHWCELTQPLVAQNAIAPCRLETAAWQIGEVIFAFAAAELFVETAIALQHEFAEQVVNTVSCLSPLVGYLPTAEAMAEGGYEAVYAYRFYNHPAPFAAGSEAALRGTMANLIQNVMQR
ncbi:MAG: neutral/alkaline non-lysosomal ceramidase N-terminal domain-containing protein [Verrucomicrobia bacterium]|nr:neutral/alkaline non-lysosomal ceramidase N-terminal domain-containing protein [Verrucomicrobiota bacterium]MCG2681651.1 neutral/alkaline non-lysosomal ceramidase N-terminal domain-containing protein [Kiritimatiellia bacterium]MBU4248103.1 neutral/alkaline non-lysosomal ceramidase N-terminal domain-containing protein [Verrucomicrobiota bacterium]MBU4290779.1 neutral/alkaline non-lysosomal ceramidase N-terminal domain-containing protein [Verrucomicrobiota bacterium]MBU4429746.1 neutral/alkali